MMFKAMEMEYGMMENRSTADVVGADGYVSIFQKSLSFIFQVNNSFKG